MRRSIIEEDTVQADDPRLEAKRQELFERIKKMDELMVTVLKNHIGLEQFMSEYLEAAGKKPEDLSFYEKAEECEGLIKPAGGGGGDLGRRVRRERAVEQDCAHFRPGEDQGQNRRPPRGLFGGADREAAQGRRGFGRYPHRAGGVRAVRRLPRRGDRRCESRKEIGTAQGWAARRGCRGAAATARVGG